ncbi:MAG: hypothetical protein SO176_00910 [Bacilli bacterium]|nr:hypothetical protein [Bacilli bacterium]
MPRIRYQNLYDRLKAIIENKITFSLETLINLVDGQLPNSAKLHPTAFFANSEGNSYSHSWMDAGFIARYDKENKELIVVKYRNDFLNAVYKHSVTRE